ncbi:acyltransferase [Pedobacter sp. HMF7647]|uniref:Acyltransferase n=1 Tax=Hufsiella arboris TaxID=2695275 RepID=A0A7K1YC27_9SPHI|nr:acyltransferase [Hufsiella arboris]MXV52125.1 acyltransferase [Hufsiella arboris]
MKLLRLAYKGYKSVKFKFDRRFCKAITKIRFALNGVDYQDDFMARGLPVINVSMKGKLKIGNRFIFHCGRNYNVIGRQQPLYLIVREGAELIIGNNVGISSSAIICQHRIEIEDDVKIGGNVVIYDSDFHSLDAELRKDFYKDKANVKTKPVLIRKGAFIGAHAIILKGVTIGENAIVGAGAVVSKDIPANQVWAGNPAKFVKELDSVVV